MLQQIYNKLEELRKLTEKEQLKLSADNGTFHVNAADGAKTGRWFSFVPDQDTVFTALTGYNIATPTTSVNFLTDTTVGLNISGKTLKQGSYFSVPAGYVITATTVSSGAVCFYKLL